MWPVGMNYEDCITLENLVVHFLRRMKIYMNTITTNMSREPCTLKYEVKDVLITGDNLTVRALCWVELAVTEYKY